jgi:hypothetical protein
VVPQSSTNSSQQKSVTRTVHWVGRPFKLYGLSFASQTSQDFPKFFSSFLFKCSQLHFYGLSTLVAIEE